MEGKIKITTIITVEMETIILPALYKTLLNKGLCIIIITIPPNPKIITI